jgi:hypothetical protein
MKRVLAAIALTLALTGCSGPQEPSGTEIPSVVGMAGDEAQEALRDAGFKVEWDAGEDDVWMASNWTVDGQDPAAGERAEDGATITLAVSKPAAPEPTAAPAPAEASTSTGLTETYAISACQQYGDANFTYGWDAHWVLGKLANEIQADQWFLKVEADVTNAYGADAAMNVECFVSGTNDAPIVTAFNAY